MITLQSIGEYILAETKSRARVLKLNDDSYVWLLLPSIGDVLSYSTRQHELTTTLSCGEFRLYDVQDDPDFVDLQHLELKAGESAWQGYLLLTGLPHKSHKRSRIIATKEVITDRSEAQMKQQSSDAVEMICMQPQEVL